jgi:hypothetical protein
MKATIKNHGTIKFPHYLVMINGKEFCATNSRHNAQKIVDLLDIEERMPTLDEAISLGKTSSMIELSEREMTFIRLTYKLIRSRMKVSSSEKPNNHEAEEKDTSIVATVICPDCMAYNKETDEELIKCWNCGNSFRSRIEEKTAENYEWVCNECNTPNFTANMSENEINAELYSCINCGCFEFHKRTGEEK